MRARDLVPLLLMLAAAPVFGQSGGGVAPIDSRTPAEQAEPDEIVEVEAPTARMTTNIAFVVDTSGSMDNGGRVQMAITFARNLVERPNDQLMVALLSFKDTHTRWPGYPYDESEGGRPPPKGWTYFPGIPQLESAQRWLSERGASGGTNPVSALNEVLGEGIDDLTVVLITDGDDFDVPAFKKAVADGQAARVARGLDPATIFVIGVGPSAQNRQHLRDVGREGGGGFFVIQRPVRPDPPPDLPDPGQPDLQDPY